MSHRSKAETHMPRVPGLCPGGDLLETRTRLLSLGTGGEGPAGLEGANLPEHDCFAL